jgi:hypothetical protein
MQRGLPHEVLLELRQELVVVVHRREVRRSAMALPRVRADATTYHGRYAGRSRQPAARQLPVVVPSRDER